MEFFFVEINKHFAYFTRQHCPQKKISKILIFWLGKIERALA